MAAAGKGDEEDEESIVQKENGICPGADHGPDACGGLYRGGGNGNGSSNNPFDFGY